MERSDWRKQHGCQLPVVSNELPAEWEERKQGLLDGSDGELVLLACEREPEAVEEEDTKDSDNTVEAPNDEGWPDKVAVLGPVKVGGDEEDPEREGRRERYKVSESVRIKITSSSSQRSLSKKEGVETYRTSKMCEMRKTS
jgi:hypothetical protein